MQTTTINNGGYVCIPVDGNLTKNESRYKLVPCQRNLHGKECKKDCPFLHSVPIGVRPSEEPLRRRDCKGRTATSQERKISTFKKKSIPPPVTSSFPQSSNDMAIKIAAAVAIASKKFVSANLANGGPPFPIPPPKPLTFQSGGIGNVQVNYYSEWKTWNPPGHPAATGVLDSFRVPSAPPCIHEAWPNSLSVPQTRTPGRILTIDAVCPPAHFPFPAAYPPQHPSRRYSQY